jgi:hypothetical protein
MGRAAMKRPARAKVYRNVVEWLDSLPPERKKRLKQIADNAEKIRKATHG